MATPRIVINAKRWSSLPICWLLVEQRSWLWLVGAGLLLGLATLVKAQTLVVVPLILAIELLGKEGFWRRLPAAIAKFAALIALAALVGFIAIARWAWSRDRQSVFDEAARQPLAESDDDAGDAR